MQMCSTRNLWQQRALWQVLH
ncbi:hypothetical protein Pint_19494 [Pistacia integerrima]|uniref:Uncharacterized protein n=1 Tax=Pistacia integerrima TaxID=434235 RepID=A0ACC0YZE5_9ROSI|nr:hypothetical protein Pint_19494 [Pistacia integerrima]